METTGGSNEPDREQLEFVTRTYAGFQGLGTTLAGVLVALYGAVKLLWRSGSFLWTATGDAGHGYVSGTSSGDAFLLSSEIRLRQAGFPKPKLVDDLAKHWRIYPFLSPDVQSE